MTFSVVYQSLLYFLLMLIDFFFMDMQVSISLQIGSNQQRHMPPYMEWSDMFSSLEITYLWK